MQASAFGRLGVVVTVVVLGLSGCLSTMQGKRGTLPEASPSQLDGGKSRAEELPMPRLFGVGLDLSVP